MVNTLKSYLRIESDWSDLSFLVDGERWGWEGLNNLILALPRKKKIEVKGSLNWLFCFSLVCDLKSTDFAPLVPNRTSALSDIYTLQIFRKIAASKSWYTFGPLRKSNGCLEYSKSLYIKLNVDLWGTFFGNVYN